MRPMSVTPLSLPSVPYCTVPGIMQKLTRMAINAPKRSFSFWGLGANPVNKSQSHVLLTTDGRWRRKPRQADAEASNKLEMRWQPVAQ